MGSAAGQREYADKYSAEFAQQADKAQGVTERNTSRYGVPGSGRYAGTQRSLEMMRATGGAQAASSGREAARSGSRRIMAGMMGPGMNLSSQSGQTLGSAAGMLGSAADRNAAQSEGMLDRVFGLIADGGYVDIPDGEGGRLPAPINDSQPADGGEIRGPGTSTSDSIKARVSDGEYYFPQYAVKYYGTDKLDKMIIKAREAESDPEGPRAKMIEGPPGPQEATPGFEGGLWGMVAKKMVEKGVEKGGEKIAEKGKEKGFGIGKGSIPAYFNEDYEKMGPEQSSLPSFSERMDAMSGDYEPIDMSYDPRHGYRMGLYGDTARRPGYAAGGEVNADPQWDEFSSLSGIAV